MPTVETLKNAGFENSEIQDYTESQTERLRSAGFTDLEIGRYFGTIKFNPGPIKEQVRLSVRQGEEPNLWNRFWRIFEPDWETRKAISAISLEKAKETGEPPHVFEPNYTEIAESGFEQSVTGLIYRGKAPDKPISAESLKHLPAAKRIALHATTLAGDLPFMIAGAMIGGGGGPQTALGGAFALPHGLRKVYIDKYEKGEVKNFKDFWERLAGATFETLKGEATGIATGAAAPAGLGAEIATMVTVGNLLEGTIPEPQEFLDAAIIIGAMKMSTRTATKLRNIWVETGKTPKQVMMDIEENPDLRREILSDDEELPEQYKPKKPEEKIRLIYDEEAESTRLKWEQDAQEAMASEWLKRNKLSLDQVKKLTVALKSGEIPGVTVGGYRFTKANISELESIIEHGPKKIFQEPETYEPGDMLLADYKGNIYSGKGTYANVLLEHELRAEDIVDTGLVDKQGNVIWGGGPRIKEQRIISETPKFREKAKARKIVSRQVISQKEADAAKTFRAYVRAKGGINQNDPNYKGEIADISKGARWQPGVKSKKGLMMDELLAQAKEDGWGDLIQTENDVLEALTTDLTSRTIAGSEADLDALYETEIRRLKDEGILKDEDIEIIDRIAEEEAKAELQEETGATAEELGDWFNEQRMAHELGSLLLRERNPDITYKFNDLEIESRYDAAIPPRPSLWQKLNENLINLKNKITREFEHLPKTAEFAELGFALRKLQKQRSVAENKTYTTIRDMLSGMSYEDFNIFTRKVILDDLRETADLQIKDGKIKREEIKLPYGFKQKTLESEITRINTVIDQNPRLSEALKQRDIAWKDIVKDYTKSMKDIGFDVSKKLTRQNYYRHQVLNYIEAKGLFGTGRRLRTPTGRSFLKHRKGSELDISRDFIEAESEVMAQMLYDIQVADTIKLVKDQYDIAPVLRKTAKGQEMLFNELIPEGYSEWQPREGNVFYIADSIPARLAEELTLSGLDEALFKYGEPGGGPLEPTAEVRISKKDLRKVLAIGGKRKTYVLPDEIIATLNELTTDKSTNVISIAHRKLINAWKIWQLLMPRRLFKYNARNMTGDADAAFAGNPAGFKKLPEAVEHLYRAFATKKPLEDSLKDWMDRGGTQTTLQLQEMGDLNRLKMFIHRNSQKSIATEIPIVIWQKYWSTVRLATDFREAILRYANYLEYLEQLEKSPIKKPRNYGASIPEEVDALSDIKDKAFMLANDLLGAYDRVGVAGQALRSHLYPFWSWKEVNFKRYVQMFRNAARDDQLSYMIGRKMLGQAARTPFRAIKIGKWMIQASAFWGMLQVYNNLFFRDEEQDLPETIRSRPHVILGRDENGEVQYFSRLGALPDLLEWFGLDTAPTYVDKWFKGKMSLKEIAEDMAKQPVNITVQGIEPFGKTVLELLTRQGMFPDAFRPRAIKDRLFHIARSFGLEKEYLAISKRPGRPYSRSLENIFYYKIDPLNAAYSDILAERSRFLRKIGKGGEGFWITPRGNALWNARLAIRYQDMEAFKSYMAKYLKFGGTFEGLNRSIENMQPLSGMIQADKASFIAQLTSDQRKQLVKAYYYWAELASGQDISAKFEKK